MNYMLCVHASSPMAIGPFAPDTRFIADEFMAHLQAKWPDLEAHLVELDDEEFAGFEDHVRRIGAKYGDNQ